MPERSCPSCHEPVAAHQTLCPVCRTPVPSESGPVASDSSAFTFTAPPPRAPRAPEPAPPPTWSAPDDPGTAGPFAVAPEPAAAPVDPTTTYGGGGAWQPAPDVTWADGPVAPAPTAAAPVAPAPAVPPASASASAGTLGTPGAAVLDERGNLPGGVVGLLAAALVTVGVFLPWIGVEGRDVSGWAASGDAKVLLGLAGLATVIAALLIGGARSLLLRLGLVALGVVALGLGAYEVASANGIDEFDVSLGAGLFLVLAGGAALAVSGVLTRHKRYL